MEIETVANAGQEAPGTEEPAFDLAALGRGDPAAVDAFYRALFEPVYAFVFWRVGGVRQDAEDVTQETFLTALRTLASFQQRASLQTWVCGIARNLARERLRARDRDAARGSDADVLRALALIASEPIAEGVLAREETHLRVGTALSGLPVHYQQALVDKYVHGRSFAEMARAENRSPKAVESTVQRAKAAFAEALARGSSGVDDE
jgi:RNA polymerase sigma-70 factor (ECF subfamily)